MPFYSLGFILENSLRVCRVFQKLEMFRIPKAELLFGECSFPRFLCPDLLSLDTQCETFGSSLTSNFGNGNSTRQNVNLKLCQIFLHFKRSRFECTCALCIPGEIISESSAISWCMRGICMPDTRGGGVLKKVLYGEAPPRGPTSYPFIYHFFRKGTSFVYLLLEKGTPFIYLVTTVTGPSYE